MSRSFVYGTVRDTPRAAIYVVRVRDGSIDDAEVGEIAERMREKIILRGDSASDVVVVQGDTKETLRVYGTPYSAQRVRTAMFNAAIRWIPTELD